MENNSGKQVKREWNFMGKRRQVEVDLMRFERFRIWIDPWTRDVAWPMLFFETRVGKGGLSGIKLTEGSDLWGPGGRGTLLDNKVHEIPARGDEVLGFLVLQIQGIPAVDLQNGISWADPTLLRNRPSRDLETEIKLGEFQWKKKHSIHVGLTHGK